MTASAVKQVPDSKAAGQADKAGGVAGGKGRRLSWETFAFLTVASLVSIAQLPAAAEYGLGAVTLYLLPALLFLIPVALVAAELAMARSGGVFDWVAAGISAAALPAHQSPRGAGADHVGAGGHRHRACRLLCGHTGCVLTVPLLPLVASIGILASIAGIAIGLVPPAQFKEGPPVTYALLLIAGVALLALPPQIIYQLRRPHWRSEEVAAASDAE